MTQFDHIEDALRARLATVITDIRAGKLTPTQAALRLQAQDFAALRAQFVGQTIIIDGVRLDIAPGGDDIKVGDIKDAKGVAIGRDANAQVVEGDGNIVVGPGGVVINLPASRISTIPFMAPDLPADFVPRPEEFERIVAHLLGDGAGPVAISAALRGAGGFGKTTLATAVCHDTRVRAAFPGGILWATLGEQPTLANIVGKLDDLVALLSGAERQSFASLEAATARFGEVLGEQRLLLVVDDVWESTHLAPFLHGGPRTARLITTRNRDTLPTDTRAVDVDAMQQAEALKLLGAGIPGVEAHTAALQGLAAKLGEWPLLLTIVNGVLRDEVAAGVALSEALGYAQAGFEEAGITVFDTESDAGRRHAVARTLEVSLGRLSDAARARFAELAIFGEDVDIPLLTLQRYWGATGKLSTFAVKQLCGQLHARSLLLAYDRAAGTIRLHDVVRAYLVQKHQPELTGWHRALLDALRPASGKWADLANDEPYLWEQLAAHLQAAGRADELIATAQDLRYLARKLHLRTFLSVEADLRLATDCAPDAAALPRLQRTIANAAHLFSACPSEHDLAATLLGRLAFESPLRDHAALLAQTLARPYLAPLYPPPDLPDPALLRTLEGHTAVVTGCAFSPDGSRLASASEDQIVRLWEVGTGQLLRTFAGHASGVAGCAFSPDGSRLASASQDSTVRLWDAGTGELLRAFAGHVSGVTGCAFSPDGSRLVSTSNDSIMRLWDAGTGELLRIFWAHTAGVAGCAFSPDGSRLASASEDQIVRLWEVGTGELLRTFAGHASGVAGCAFSPDGSHLASASHDRTVRLWEVATGQLLRTFAGHTYTVTGCAFSPDGSRLASASWDKTVRLWDVGTGKLLHTLVFDDLLSSCAFSPDGRQLVATGGKGVYWLRIVE
jgi:hypothetical protein